MRADEAFISGVRILTPLMQAHGFAFVPLSSGDSSGGWRASGEFRREPPVRSRRLELHFRNSLGLVTYHVGSISLSHTDYMRALKVKNQYPGFSDDPLDGFRHLYDDIERYAIDFLDGPGEQFEDCVRDARRFNAVSGFKRLSEAG